MNLAKCVSIFTFMLNFISDNSSFSNKIVIIILLKFFTIAFLTCASEFN